MQTHGNIYKILFFVGVFGLLFLTILQIISLLFNCNDFKDLFEDDFDFCNGTKFKTIIDNFKNFQSFGSYFTFLLFIFDFCEMLCIWLLIYYFSVNHFSAINTIPIIFLFFVKEKENSINKIYFIIGSMIIILMTLVYNQIIILRFCELDKYTKIELERRASFELDIKSYNYDEIDYSDNVKETIEIPEK